MHMCSTGRGVRSWNCHSEAGVSLRDICISTARPMPPPPGVEEYFMVESMVARSRHNGTRTEVTLASSILPEVGYGPPTGSPRCSICSSITPSKKLSMAATWIRTLPRGYRKMEKRTGGQIIAFTRCLPAPVRRSRRWGGYAVPRPLDRWPPLSRSSMLRTCCQ